MKRLKVKRGKTATRRDAERAVRVLQALAGNGQGAGEPGEFGHLAFCSDRFIVTIDRAQTGGLEKRLLVTPTDGLTDEEYLACVYVPNSPLDTADSD